MVWVQCLCCCCVSQAWTVGGDRSTDLWYNCQTSDGGYHCTPASNDGLSRMDLIIPHWKSSDCVSVTVPHRGVFQTGSRRCRPSWSWPCSSASSPSSRSSSSCSNWSRADASSSPPSSRSWLVSMTSSHAEKRGSHPEQMRVESWDHLQWWNVTTYIYSITVPKCNFEVLVLDYFHFPLFYTPEKYFTSLHLF